MRNVNYVFLLPLAVSALSLAASAQVTSLPVSGPYQHVQLEYNLESGVLTRLPETQLQQSTVQRRGVFALGSPAGPCFENNTIAGNVAIITTGAEWLDWGTKVCSGTEFLSSIEIGWATRELDPLLGGAGGAMEIALYEGTVGELGTAGTEVLRLPLLGLPGSADGLSYTPYLATLTLTGVGLEAPQLSDGKFGWGVQRLDQTTGPLLVHVEPSAMGPDSFGYEADVIPDGFDDISTTGVDATGMLSDLDDGGALLPIGFDFEFYGASMTGISVATNGYLTTSGDLDDFSPQCFPSDTDGPKPSIAPAWSDLRLVEHGAIYFETKGVAPCREFIVQWHDVGTFEDSGASVTMQAKLFETTNAIEFHYGAQVSTVDFNADGSEATVGIESNTSALEIACSQSGSVAQGQSYRMTLGRESSNGVVDSLASFSAPASTGVFGGTFSFGSGTGGSANVASMCLSITEESGACATAAFTPANPTSNPSLYTSDLAPILGSTWKGTVDVSSFASPTTTYLAVAASLGACQAGCMTPFGLMLIDPQTILFINEAAPVAGVSTHLVELPPIISECGEVYFTQVAVLDPSSFPQLTFTNAIDMRLGF